MTNATTTKSKSTYEMRDRIARMIEGKQRIRSRLFPCGCGCQGSDPWHARTFTRRIDNVVVLDVVQSIEAREYGRTVEVVALATAKFPFSKTPQPVGLSLFHGYVTEWVVLNEDDPQTRVRHGKCVGCGDTQRQPWDTSVDDYVCQECGCCQEASQSLLDDMGDIPPTGVSPQEAKRIAEEHRPVTTFDIDAEEDEGPDYEDYDTGEDESTAVSPTKTMLERVLSEYFEDPGLHVWRFIRSLTPVTREPEYLVMFEHDHAQHVALVQSEEVVEDELDWDDWDRNGGDELAEEC